jgi:hypothetical protein
VGIFTSNHNGTIMVYYGGYVKPQAFVHVQVWDMGDAPSALQSAIFILDPQVPLMPR